MTSDNIVKLSGENHVDYRDVYEWFAKLRDEYGIYILKIGYDRYSAQYLIDDLKGAGFQTDDVWQGENLAPVIREFEGVIKDGTGVLDEFPTRAAQTDMTAPA